MTQLKSEVLENLHEAISPNIIGNDLLKRFYALQMFSNPNGDEKLNFLIIGGSACAKSEMALFFKSIMPDRVGYINRYATPIGIATTLINSNNGWVIADEFDKYDKKNRGMFMEAMSNDMVTVHKHGEHHEYRAMTNVIALCNPSSPELNKDRSLISQLPANIVKDYYIIGRFNFVIPAWPASPTEYQDIATKYMDKNELQKLSGRLREIAINARMNIPTVHINEELKKEIGKHVEYLKIMNTNDNGLMINPRLIRGLFSAVKARARMCGRKTAEKVDFEYIKSLMERVL